MLTIALPNGSLLKKTQELFFLAGICIPDPTRQHWVEIGNEFLQSIVWIKPQDIPEAIACGMVDGGITGEDCYWEWFWRHLTKRSHLRQWARLAYSKQTNNSNKVVLVVAKDEIAMAPFEGEFVFTEFPHWTEASLLYRERVKAVPAAGSVEAWIGRKYRFGITITETGESLQINNLKAVRTLAVSSPILISRKEVSQKEVFAFNFLIEKLTVKRKELICETLGGFRLE